MEDIQAVSVIISKVFPIQLFLRTWHRRMSLLVMVLKLQEITDDSRG